MNNITCKSSNIKWESTLYKEKVYEPLLKLHPLNPDGSQVSEAEFLQLLGSYIKTLKSRQDVDACTASSVLTSIANAISMGLPTGDGQGYFGVLDLGQNRPPECTFIPGYQGLINIAFRSGFYISSGVVRCGDEFDYDEGTNNFIKHKKNGSSTREITHAFAIAKNQHGMIISMEIMDIDELNKCRSTAGGESYYWKYWPEEMYRQTPTRRLFKYLPKGYRSSMSVALELSNTANASKNQAAFLGKDVLEELGIEKPKTVDRLSAVTSEKARKG